MQIIDKLFGNEFPWYQIYKKEQINKKIKFSKCSLYEKIVETKNNYPHNIAYSYYGNSVTYTKFVEQIDQCAKALKYDGVKAKDVVTICSPNIPEAIIAFYAINKIGAIANMVHPLSSENEFKNYFEISGTTYLFIVDFIYDKIKDVVTDSNICKTVLFKINYSMDPITNFGFWITKGRKMHKVDADSLTVYYSTFISNAKYCNEDIKYKSSANDVAVILYSGGTTGKSKGIMHTNMSFNSVAYQELVICKDLKAGVSVLSAMPIFHGFGLGSTIHAPLYVGGRCILLPTFSAKKFGDIIKKYRPNIIACVPTLYEAIINSNKLKKMNLSFLTCAICGGDTLTKSLKQKVDRFFHEHYANVEVRASYGMTECASGVTMMPKKYGIDSGIGIPCPGSIIKIVSPSTHEELPYGEEGEICVCGPSVMLGYLNEPKETAMVLQRHKDGRIYLHTGDLGSMDEKGYVYFEQRLKRLIVSSGYNIYPNQIEDIIETHPDVLSCTVIGIPHKYKVQVAKAFIVLKDGVDYTFKIKKEIKDIVKDNISQYAQPYDYEFRESLPTTKLGKIAFRTLEEEETKKYNNNSLE